jgi:hypothetical protein
VGDSGYLEAMAAAIISISAAIAVMVVLMFVTVLLERIAGERHDASVT